MRFLRRIAGLALTILALVGGVFIAARMAVPGLIPGQEVDQAILAAAMVLVDETSRGDRLLYLSLDQRDPDQNSLATLRRKKPDLEIKPMSERTSKNDHCTPKEGLVIVGACKKDDFLDIRYVAMPLWGVTLLRATTAACGAEIVTVKFLETWKVASPRWVCT